jgi:hypothetical protein
MRAAAFVLLPVLALAAAGLPARAADVVELGPGDTRFDETLLKLLRHGQRRIPNRPPCPTTRPAASPDAAPAGMVSIAEAFAGALRRESEGAGSLRFRLRCQPAGGSKTIDECRLTVSAADGNDESSAGLAFETPTGSSALALSSVRCVMTP